MPYTTIGQLPKAVKDNLPKHARNIWMSAYNAAVQQGHDESSCAAIAWAAVEKSYSKDEAGKWVHKHDQKKMALHFPSPEGEFQAEGPKKFWKELIYAEKFIHPQNPEINFEVTSDRMQRWVDNFNKGVVENVTIPLRHSDEPDRNTGTVEALEIRGFPRVSLWGLLNIADEAVAEKIGKTILGCSIRVESDFMDALTGENYGEVLSHVALTNNPHIPDLAGFIEAESQLIEDIITLMREEDFKRVTDAEKGGIKLEIVEKMKEFVSSLEAETDEAKVKESIRAFVAEHALEEPSPTPEPDPEPPSQITAEKESESIDFEKLPASVREKLAEFEAFKAQKNDEEDSRLVEDFEMAGKLTPAVRGLAMSILKAGRSQSVDFEGGKTDIRAQFEKLLREMPARVDFTEHGKVDAKPPTREELVEQTVARMVATLPK